MLDRLLEQFSIRGRAGLTENLGSDPAIVSVGCWRRFLAWTAARLGIDSGKPADSERAAEAGLVLGLKFELVCKR